MAWWILVIDTHYYMINMFREKKKTVLLPASDNGYEEINS